MSQGETEAQGNDVVSVGGEGLEQHPAFLGISCFPSVQTAYVVNVSRYSPFISLKLPFVKKRREIQIFKKPLRLLSEACFLKESKKQMFLFDIKRASGLDPALASSTVHPE